MTGIKKIGFAIVIVIFGILFFISINSNALKIAPDRLYYKYQWDAEALVVGRIAADEHHKSIPGNTNLALVHVSDGASWHMQAYGLIENKALPDFTSPVLSPQVIPNIYRNHIKTDVLVVVLYSAELENYIGRQAYLAENTRTISFIERIESYAVVYLSGTIFLPEEKNASQMRISGAPIDMNLLQTQTYKSQYGLQGSIFSKLHSLCHFTINELNALNALLFVVIVMALALSYTKIFPVPFAAIFFLSVFLSPWITVIAKNLYWLPVLWFLPALFASCFLLARATIYKSIFLLLVYLAFFIKCLTGYEFISAIILFAAAPFMYLFVTHIHEQNKWRYARGFFLICFLGVAGFTTALLIHAGTRGDTILEGLKSIYELDVKRRTYDNASLYQNDTRYEVYASLATSVWAVLHTYISGWYTDIIKFIPSWTFTPMFIGSIAVCAVSLFSKSRQALIHIGLLFAFVPVALSWHILAKAHSYVHPHINYVLWYMGAVAAIIYICFSGFNSLINLLSNTTPSQEKPRT